MERYMIIADAHLEQRSDPDPAYLLAKKVAKSQKSKLKGVINLGDMLDLSYISKYNEHLPGLNKDKALIEDYNILKKELTFWSSIGKDNYFLAGNHEDRLERYMLASPALAGLLGIKPLVEELGIKYLSTKQQPYLLLDDLYITHGISFAKYYTANSVQSLGASVICGHAHRSQIFAMGYPGGRVATGYGMGTLGPTNPGYLAGKRISGHSQSIAFLYIDRESGVWDITMHMIKDGKVIVNNKVYSL